jgi:4-hydroxy-tetrahydrodipicolinate synthase
VRTGERQEKAMLKKRLRGVFSFTATPTRDDGATIDLDRLRPHLDWQIENGVHGIAVLGSTGSNGSFTEKEREELIKAATKHINGRVTVMAGTGSITTDEAVRMSRFAEDVGADAVIVVPITYWPLTDNEVYEHYSRIAKAIKIPVVVYNNPGTTGVDIKPPLLARLAEIDNIQGVKESSGDLSRITQIRMLTKGKMTVFHGWEPVTLQGFCAGAEGWCPGLPNVLPRECVMLFDLCVEKKDLREAQALFDRMFPICKLMGDTGYIRVVHTALDLMGRPIGPPRRPLRMLEAEHRAQLATILQELGVLDRSLPQQAAE